jgi:putative ABC transport system permease protein
MMAFGKVERADRPGDLSEDLIVPLYEVWPNYFAAVGIPIKDGRGFGDDEPLDSVVVSESFAAKFWPNGRAIGQRVRFEGDEWRTIVGVAGEVRQLTLDDSTGSFEFYQPLRRPRGLPPPKDFRSGAIIAYRTLVVRALDVDATLAALRAAVHETDRRVVVWRLDPVDRLFADAIARPRLVLLLMAVFAGLGLVLAAAGIYGVLSYAVVQRRREIGIRLALGARPDGVGRAILVNGLALTTIGLGIGVLLAMALMGVMRSLLYEVEPTDPFSVAGVAIVLLVVALAASWQPARRAMRIDPVRLLREE